MLNIRFQLAFNDYSSFNLLFANAKHNVSLYTIEEDNTNNRLNTFERLMLVLKKEIEEEHWLL